RSPLMQRKAVILRMTTVNEAFDTPNKPLSLTIETTLDLGGMGIRGMCYDEKKSGYWIIAGLAPDPDEANSNLQNDWSIWFWNGNRELHKRWQKAKLPAGA